jgi:hypothetical protein
MKENAENSPADGASQDAEVCSSETPRIGSGVAALKRPLTRARRSRPEIAVLGWKERFYRLALRESKA